MNQYTRKIIETFGVKVAALVSGQKPHQLRYMIDKYNIRIPSADQSNQAVADLLKTITIRESK